MFTGLLPMPSERMPIHILILALGCSGLLFGGLATALGASYEIANGLALFTLIFLIFLLWSSMRQLHVTRQAAIVSLLAGSLFWYSYGNAMAAIFAPTRCLAWTPCFSAREIVTTYLYFSAFLAGIGLTYRTTQTLCAHSFSDGSSYGADGGSLRHLDVIAAVAIFVGVLPVLTSGLSLAELILVTSLGRGEEKEWAPTSNIGGDSSTLFWAARLLFVAGLTLAFARIVTAPISNRRRFLFLALWCIPFAFQALDSGTRFVTLSILLPGLALKFLQSGGQLRLGRAALIVFALIAISQAQLLSRSEHDSGHDELESFRTATLFGTADFFHETANALRLYDNLRGPIFDNDLLIFGSYLVPRFLWPGKPIPEVVREYTYYRWGIDILTEAGNVFPGLLGQYVISLGVLGPVLVGMLFGLLALLLDNRLRVANASMTMLPFLCYCVGLFLSFRYLSPGYFVTPLLVHMAVYFGVSHKGPRRWQFVQRA